MRASATFAVTLAWSAGKQASQSVTLGFYPLDLAAPGSFCLEAEVPVGAQVYPEKQTVLHDYIAQIERDLCKIGFGVHDDALCELKSTHKPKGSFIAVAAGGDKLHHDKNLTDIPYLIRKFQRQAQWLWRMKADGTALPDAKVGEPTVYTGPVNGEVDAQVAKVLHAWVEQDLHMVTKKFELAALDWPPGSGKVIANADGGSAQLRKDAQEAWLKAATEAESLGATMAGPYASSPRKWTSGKPAKASASPYSWHYSGLAIDLGRPLQFADATITDKAPYGLEKDGDKFRIWCWVSPQPPAPTNSADDKKDPLTQYRNRNLKYKHKRGAPNEKKKASEVADPAPLYFATTTKTASNTDVEDVTAKEGWYVDITSILEKHGFKRISRKKSWLSDPEAWEWWHYQYEPQLPPGASSPPTFGEYLQLYGVHEARLRAVAWSAHEDIEKIPL
ncbi:hypothetical protein, partial [Archangium sp.]|uniref:hypothetical protein n=1 Tax=Archangium sp. TaxID=1872627 RepID=UPI002D3D37E6